LTATKLIVEITLGGLELKPQLTVEWLGALYRTNKVEILVKVSHKLKDRLNFREVLITDSIPYRKSPGQS